MTATVDVSWGSVNIDSADPARLADFWGKALGRPVSPGFTPRTTLTARVSTNSARYRELARTKQE